MSSRSAKWREACVVSMTLKADTCRLKATAIRVNPVTSTERAMSTSKSVKALALLFFPVSNVVTGPFDTVRPQGE